MIVAWWADALRVVARDPVLQSVIESCREEALQETDDLMRSMVRAVCGQQVHNSAAKAAQSRVLAFAGNTAGAELARALVAADETALAALVNRLPRPSPNGAHASICTLYFSIHFFASVCWLSGCVSTWLTIGRMRANEHRSTRRSG